MAEITILRDLAVVMIAAAATTLLFSKLRQSAVIGFVAAGLLIGPHARFPLVENVETIQGLADLGIVFLLFSLGLEFHLARLRRVGGVALSAGVLEIGIMLALGFGAGRLMGWNPVNSLFLGAILAISSTTIIAKVLSETGKLQTGWAEVIFGILIVEDVAAVILMALLSSVALTGAVSLVSVVAILTRVGIFITVALVLGILVVPRLVDYVRRFRSEDLLVVTVLGLAFGMALFAEIIGFSEALGAFIAGAVIAEARAAAHVEQRIAPLRDAFTAVFFVAVGMLIDPATILAYALPILALTVLSVLGKIGSVTFANFISGYPPREALKVGIGLAMIGEFSFVIAALGAELGVTRPEIFAIAVGVSAFSTLITPHLVRHSDAIVEAAGRIAPGPLRGYAMNYHRWMSRLRTAPTAGRGNGAEALRGHVQRVITYTILFAGLLVAAGYLDDIAVRLLGNEIFVPGDTIALAWMIFALLAVPVGAGAVFALRGVVHDLADRAVPPRDKNPRTDAVRRVVLASFWLFGAVLLGALLLAIGGSFLPPLPLVLPVVAMVATAGILLWGSLRRLHEQVEAAVNAVLQHPASEEDRSQLAELIQQKSAWGVHVEGVDLPPHSRFAHRSIREMRIPQTTGATIVSVEHEGKQIVNPAPDTLVHGGDRIVLMGERHQVDATKSLLRETATPDTPPETSTDRVELKEFAIPPDSPLLGRTLAQSRLREASGASVVGLRRDGEPVIHPAPTTRLREGDVLLILGSPEQLARADARIRSG